ncbi:MAG: hypothetical protein ACKO1G_08485, partial [Microcystis aeruginosa]
PTLHKLFSLLVPLSEAEGISIGSGSVESKIKQIAHRLKITGASWESGNVPQVLRHRCAYLNGCLF